MSYVTEGCSALAPWRGPLFVIGIWRSGTSLLYALLNKHPQISLLYEGDLYCLRPLFWIPRAASSWLARWDLWKRGPQAARTRYRTNSVECFSPPNRHGKSLPRVRIPERSSHMGREVYLLLRFPYSSGPDLSRRAVHHNLARPSSDMQQCYPRCGRTLLV